ncbi:hypothetical protein DMP17_44030 [Pseudonocardia sp. TMWB2A]
MRHQHRRGETQVLPAARTAGPPRQAASVPDDSTTRASAAASATTPGGASARNRSTVASPDCAMRASAGGVVPDR